MNELHLFAGAGGGILGGMLLGHTCVCAVEIEPYPRKVLLQRQRDGILPKFPIWDDVRTFDGKPWRGRVQIVCGGFPCQDISSAGGGAGLSGERSGLWKEFARVVREVEPAHVFVENSPILTSRGLGRVLGDLASMGYDAKWGVLSAGAVGANHKRSRMWLVAHSSSDRLQGRPKQSLSTSGTLQGGSRGPLSWEVLDRAQFDRTGNEDMPQPCLAGMENDVAHRNDRLKSIGNGQVPAVAALAWRTLAPQV